MVQITIQDHPSHVVNVVNVGKVTVEDIVQHLGKDVASVIGKNHFAAMSKTKAIHANDLNGDEDSQDEQREDFHRIDLK